MENKYTKITNFFNYLQAQFGVHICIKDFCGFVPINKELDGALRPFLAHTNAYCMYIKQDKEKYYDCLSMIRKCHEKIEKDNRSFFGMCHGGLGEYVTPILSNGALIGTINMGFFSPGEQRSLQRIHKVCASSRLLEEETAKRLFGQNIAEPTIERTAVIPMMELVAEYLGTTYAILASTHDCAGMHKRYHSSEDDILLHAATYVRQNFINHMTVAELAGFCHCSESYLSHIFKKRMGVSISTYMNKIRIESAKNYLVSTDLSIAEISMNTGFDDPNYFSRVFARLVSIPPAEYRRRFRENRPAKLASQGLPE